MDDIEVLEQGMDAGSTTNDGTDSAPANTECQMDVLGHLCKHHFERAHLSLLPIDHGNVAMASPQCQPAAMLSLGPVHLRKMSFWLEFRRRRRPAVVALARSMNLFGPTQTNLRPHIETVSMRIQAE